MKFGKVLSVSASLLLCVASALPTGEQTTRRSSSSGSETALSALAAANATIAGGGVEIINRLNTTVYLWSVTDVLGPMQTLPAQSGVYAEPWRVNPGGGGISIKLSTAPEPLDILQFEYTQAEPTIFWDLSCINMSPDSLFTTFGYKVLSDSQDCPDAVCAPGDPACADAYLFPSDNHATHGCPIQTAFTLVLG